MEAARRSPIWVPKEDRKEKSKEKTKGNGNGNGPCYRDLTISGHDLPHTEVREGRTALNKEERRSNGVWRGLEVAARDLCTPLIGN